MQKLKDYSLVTHREYGTSLSDSAMTILGEEEDIDIIDNETETSSKLEADKSEICTEDNEAHSISASHSCHVFTRHLIVASFMAAFGGILFGYDIGIVSGALLQLKAYFNLSCLEEEIVVSAVLLGALIGSLFGGFLIDYYGRRLVIIGSDVLFVCGALFMAFTNTYILLIIGRVIAGFAVSLSSIGECIYISEISPQSKRGFLVSLNELGITLGILLAYLVNYLFIQVEEGWRYMFGLAMILAIVQGVGMITLPPSPRYLVKKGHPEKATAVLKKLWNVENVEREINAITLSILTERKYSVLDLLSSIDNMRGRMLIGAGLVFFQQVTGQTNVLYYAPTVLEDIGFKSDSAAMLATVGLGVVKVLSTTIGLMCVDKVGRRRLLLVGSAVMLFVLVTLGIVTQVLPNQQLQECKDIAGQASHSQDNHTMPLDLMSTSNLSLTSESTTLVTFEYLSGNATTPSTSSNSGKVVKWVAMASLMTYIAAYAFSFGPVAWLILSEIFPAGIRGRAASLANTFNWGTNLLVSLTFLDLLAAIGVSWTFIIYGVICALSFIFIYFLVPETKDRSLEKISSELATSSFSKKLSLKCGSCFGQQKIIHHLIEEPLLNST